jgi:hypothetical protein
MRIIDLNAGRQFTLKKLTLEIRCRRGNRTPAKTCLGIDPDRLRVSRN